MPFGLKNAGATYQRLVNRIFAEQIRSTMEVYVDDMLVKSRTPGEHLKNLSLMFGILKDYRMRLNPTKCAFGVSSGRFLGFMISQRGIEANLDKIKAIIDMEVPKTQKDIQSLTGRVAALTRFISKATDKCGPFFKALKGGKHHIEWTAECDKAFQDLKDYMGRAPLLSKHLPGEILSLYLSVSNTAVSSVLIRIPERAELPIFYVSKALQGAESRCIYTTAHKAFRQGYYWPSMHRDAIAMVKKCDKCQRFGNIPHLPAEPLTPIVSPWPFAQWGLDLIRPMPQGKGQVKYAIVAVDYFTKWVAAEALTTITAARVEEFVWTNICCRFGIPYAIITDNGRQFDSELFRQFCTRLKINLFFASPAHWETPFSLAFGSEAVVPVEIGESSYRTESFEPKANEAALALSLDLIEEQRTVANLHNEAYKQCVSRYYDSRVKPRSFRIGDWVMRKVSLATKNPTEGTLGPSWEGPYEVIGILRSGTYRLRGTDGKTLGHPWNVDHLKSYFK
ncbi:uncharacterized protein K02A2.6-like [Prunus avium]|uniref:Uncharacterized protein K02A2.6-like n=1 Tax=Prunus avium TaxID=42229 RepID=A0A6P5U1E1_PRUAV|nr:uncharacterized protein K02A2.6-like [Prunus avium]